MHFDGDEFELMKIMKKSGQKHIIKTKSNVNIQRRVDMMIYSSK
jgi:hypothetical protein